MAQPDLRLVRMIARRLTAALEQRDASTADAEIDRIMVRTLRSETRLEPPFAAVQTLRDLGVVDRSEAAYLFDYMFDLRDWNDESELDPGIIELVKNLPETTELVDAAISHAGLVKTETFYR